MHLQDIGEDARRQYIDAKGVFEAWESAKRQAAEVRGGMRWKTVGDKEYLVRTCGRSETSLGPRSPEKEAIFASFTARKSAANDRVRDLRKALDRQQRMNRALLVGRAPQILIEILNQLRDAGIEEHFITIGTHALYAYEAAAGVRFEAAALATQDIDLLWDTRKRVVLLEQMKVLDSTFLGVLRKVDKTFEIREDQLYTAINSKGFEVDIVRRESKGREPHPLKVTEGDDDDLFAVEGQRAEVLLSGPKFPAVIASASGHMARMTTVSPVAFAKFKRWMAASPRREDLKRSRDLLQAELVEGLVEEYLPQLSNE